MAVNIRSKGQRGERETIKLLSDWARPVTMAVGMPEIELTRNLVQTRGGGYDIVGLEWLALEVKRQETLSLGPWWKQTLRQTGPDQIPLLMYRQNHGKWKFRTLAALAHYSPCGQTGVSRVVVEMDEANARLWFQTELWVRIQNQDRTVAQPKPAVAQPVAQPVEKRPPVGNAQPVKTKWGKEQDNS